jgi:hypothetical protein
MGAHPRRVVSVRATAALLAAFAFAVPAGARAACPVAPDPGALPDATALREMNAVIAHGARPTGSAAQAAYIGWIRDQLRAVPGLQLSERSFPINRWSQRSAKLKLRVGDHVVYVPIASAVPYSKGTGRRGVAGPLVTIPDDQAITAANAKGRIVVRPAPAGAVPYYDFLLPIVSWMVYDPGNTIDPTANFYGDFINYNARVTDLRDAAEAGAKALLFVKDLPRAQLKGHYEPYEGTAWGVPGLFLGADEGKRLLDAASGGAGAAARVVLRTRVARVETPSLSATLPGASPQRIVIDSHTDGTNAVEDNGPVAMVAIARYLAALPAACRPRTVQFAFSTAHFYQRVADVQHRHGGAGVLAQQLDAEYDKGTVSSVLVLEHLGAIDYEGVPREDGPGQRLEPTGLRAIQFVGITPSPVLVAAIGEIVRRYDMQRTILLQGADAPGVTAPSHCSFGGEGTPYNIHLLPTVGVIAAPQPLYDPAFGMEGIDFGAMHDELLAYTELVNRLGTMSQAEVAGDIPVERQRRAAGAAPCPPEN